MTKKLLSVLLLISIFSKSYSQTHVYLFQNNFNEAGATGPALTEVFDITCVPAPANGSYLGAQTINTVSGSCGSGDQTVFSFDRGGGVAYPNNPSFITGSYTINILYKVTDFVGWQRIIDFKQGTSDFGVYSQDDVLWINSAAPVNVGGVFLDATKYYLVTIVRDGAALPNPLVNIYVNGTAVITNYNDAAGDLTPTTSTDPIRFFTDDGCETESGNVKYISLKASTSTAIEVASTWTNICGLVLPVNLTSFTAEKNNNEGMLQWQTSNEVNTNYYDVEKSYNGKTFTSIGKVNAKNGTANTYSYNDYSAFTTSSPVVYYRLRMVDINGKVRYSSIIKLSGTNDSKITLYPNPAINTVSISGLNTKDVIRLLTIDGKVLLQRNAGAQSVMLNIEKYKSGSYILQVQNENQVVQHKFVKR